LSRNESDAKGEADAPRPAGPRADLAQPRLSLRDTEITVGPCGLDLDHLRYEPLAQRPSKIALTDLGRLCDPNPRFDDWLERLPRLLGADGLVRLRDHILRARETQRPVVAAIGGHVVKTGCAPYLIDWIRRGLLQGLAMNGSAAIHDLELAIAGKTSEDVDARLMAGSFGFARETSEFFVEAYARAAARSVGLGTALGELILEHGGPGLDASLLVAARRSGIPLTIHVAIGTDIVHMSSALDGAALGKVGLFDFRILCGLVARMAGGVWLNLGSAVVMPEVFLKAVSIARNLGYSLDGLTTANLDFDQQYRGRVNVLTRPGSEGISLVGHHEILIPLLHAAVVARIAPDGTSGDGIGQRPIARNGCGK
jgi:hypothetical protein